jgi:signal transduction histidine kinase
MAAIRRPVRSRPIRLFLISMFAVPLASLIALWAFAASVTVPRAISDHNYGVVSTARNGPAVTTLTIELPIERAQTYVWLLGGRASPNAALLATRKAIDAALPGALVALQSKDDLLSPAARAALGTLLTDLRNLDSLRKSIDAGDLGPPAAFQGYSDIIDAQFRSYNAETLDRGGSLAAQSIGDIDAAYALDMAGREIALVDGALKVSSGAMSLDARQLFIASVASRRQMLAMATSLLPGAYRSGYDTAIGSPMYTQFAAMEDQIAGSTFIGPVPVSAKAWDSVSGQYEKVIRNIQTANGLKLAADSTSSSTRLFAEAILAGGVGLLAVVVSIVLLVWFGRKFTGDLTVLNDSVRAMAEERLPRVVARLRRGEDVDVPAESPPPGASGVREISAIAESFATVQEAAVVAAVDQARLRKGVSQVFLNISMRNQSLLHRQLGILDAMERQTSDPGALADLFRLDHLTTRMRRHAEGLIILSGATPGRGWREPVPVVDVLRAAVAEIEDYVRVDVLSESRDLVAGNAVNDVIHLVAELVENATVFSPPNTRIEVRADRAGTGLVAEIEDRGLGLSQPELDDINDRLANPPEFDLANSEQLGLFVVSRLAARHDIKVALRQSVYRGTTAIIVLPFGVIVREEEAGSRDYVEWPAHGRPGIAQGTVITEPSAGEPLPQATGTPAPSAFGVTGRHRLPLAAATRSAAAGAPGDAGQVSPPGRGALPPGFREAAHAPQPSVVLPWDAGAAKPWPQAFHRRGTGPQPSSPDGAGSWDSAGTSGRSEAGAGTAPQPPRPASSGSHLGMPIRVPQGSLAPQLWGRQTTPARPATDDAPGIDERSPEATRAMMLQMQHGWRLGRVDDLDDPQGAL